MNESTIWKMAHETDVFPYFFERTDLPIPRMSGFIQELWNALAKTHGKTISIDSCIDGSTNQNEIGLIGNECLSLMKEGSVVTLMEGAFVDQEKIKHFKYHSLPIFTAQVRFYEVVEYTTDTTLTLNYFLLFGIPQVLAIAIALLIFRRIRYKHITSSNQILRQLFGMNMCILLMGITIASLIYSGAYRGNTVVQTYTSTIDLSMMLDMLRMGTKIFLQAYDGEWFEEELDFIIGEDNRKKKRYATSSGRVALLESICDDDRYIAAIYPMEVVEALNQNKIQCTLREIPMTDAQAESIPNPDYFFPTPYFFLLSKKRADTRILIKEIDFLLAGPFNIETLPIWNFHASNVADRSDRPLPNAELMHAPISLTKLSHLLCLIAVFYATCLLVFVIEIISSKIRRKIKQ